MGLKLMEMTCIPSQHHITTAFTEYSFFHSRASLGDASEGLGDASECFEDRELCFGDRECSSFGREF